MTIAKRAEKVAVAMIGAIKTVARQELVADQLRNSIFLSRFLPGQKRPPERPLAIQLGVSRATVREAVRVIESEGLVDMRRGMTGGVFVWARR